MNKKQATRDYWLSHYRSFKTAGITQREYYKIPGYFTFSLEE